MNEDKILFVFLYLFDEFTCLIDSGYFLGGNVRFYHFEQSGSEQEVNERRYSPNY